MAGYTGWKGQQYTARSAETRGKVVIYNRKGLKWNGDALKAVVAAQMIANLQAAGEHMVQVLRRKIGTAGNGKPSRPGAYPKKQTGALWSSITYVIDTSKLELRVISLRTPIDRFLEFGTRFIRPRKLFRAAFAAERPRLQKILSTRAK